MAVVSVVYVAEVEGKVPAAMPEENCWKKGSEVAVTLMLPSVSQTMSAS